MSKFLGLLIFVSSSTALSQIEMKPAGPTDAPTAVTTGTSANSNANAPIKLDRSKITNRIKLQFDEDLVKGNAENTELNFIQTRKDNNFKKMIKIRENFIPEIESSASELGSK